jgi:hypothetical protein
MKRLSYTDEVEWKQARLGKVTGTKLKDIVVKRGTTKKVGFYQLIADRIAIPRPENENVMDRGHALEAFAVERLARETGLPFIQVDNEMWVRDDNADIAYSPDGYIPAKKIATACEVKCLNTASHLEGFITREVPSQYIEQTLQAFVVNEDLQTLYFVMYEPSLPPTCDYFCIVITRDEVAEQVQYLLDYQTQTLAEVDDWVNKLTLFV